MASTFSPTHIPLSLQRRRLVCIPPPQLAVQSLHAVQIVHTATGNAEISLFWHKSLYISRYLCIHYVQ